MILLDVGNRILADTVSGAIKPPVVSENDDDDKKAPSSKPTRDPVDVRLCDFDDVSYHVALPKDDPTLTVSINVPCWREISSFSAKDAVDKIYGSMVTKAEDGYDASLSFNVDNLPGKEADVVKKIELFKSNIIGSVFEKYFTALLAGKSLTENFKFTLRSDTIIYFVPRPDKIQVVYEIDFVDKVDLAVARVFMQEFLSVKKTAAFAAAPPCTFSQNPPTELKEFGITTSTKKLGYIAFAVMISHLQSNRLPKVVNTMALFRNYIAYHLKCSKAYFHSRMRARVQELIKLLNRAKVEMDDSKREKKTAQGKTFIRQS